MSVGSLQWHPGEIKDLLVAWAALGAAFALFFGGGSQILAHPDVFLELLFVSIITAGVGFLLHELAHKIVAVRFGQIAAFRANYPMLVLAIAAGAVGFIFAAPGAVYHRGRLTTRQNGLIAIAGPVTNVVLGLLFVPFLLAPHGLLSQIGVYGVLVNFFLAAFNMIPYGPLDGRKVLSWSVIAFAGITVTSVLLLIGAILLVL